MFNKLMKHYIPEADESKGSLELTLEIFGQVILLFIGLFIFIALLHFYQHIVVKNMNNLIFIPLF